MSARIVIHNLIGLVLLEVTNIELLLLGCHILIAVHRLFASMVTTRIVLITCLVKLLHLIDSMLVLSCILAEVTLVTLMDWVAGTSWCSLLTEFGLGNCFRNWWVVRMVSTGWSWEHTIITMLWWIEELCCHHHLLLLGSLLTTWCFPLIDKVKQMSLISILIITNSTCCSNSVVSDARCSCTKSAASTISFCLLIHHAHLESFLLSVVIKVIDWSGVASITLPQLSHEVTIEHGLSHLLLMLRVVSHGAWSTIIALGTEATNSRLIENMLVIFS